MERHTAILIADLSGYTALTETHGASTAADLVDTYIRLIKESLAGDCVLHQSVGDEVLIVSASPDHLLSTAKNMMQKLSNENHFLQVLGALHYGKLLIRNNSHFGTSINLTSRIANKADSGTFLCSCDFIDALSDKSEVIFRSIGQHSFKNLSEEKEIFQLGFEQDDLVVIDPICRMIIKNTQAAIKHPDTEDLFFCSPECLSSYMKRNSI